MMVCCHLALMFPAIQHSYKFSVFFQPPKHSPASSLPSLMPPGLIHSLTPKIYPQWTAKCTRHEKYTQKSNARNFGRQSAVCISTCSNNDPNKWCYSWLPGLIFIFYHSTFLINRFYFIIMSAVIHDSSIAFD